MSTLNSLLSMTFLLVITKNWVSASGSGVSCPESCTCRHAQPHGQLTTDCSNRGLSDFPSTVDPATVHLDLSRNELPYIPPGAFTGLGALQTIKLNDNWISEIPPNTFKGLNLRGLDLSRNRLAVLARDAFAGLKGRSDCSVSEPCVLNLQENNMRTVEPNSLSWTSRMAVLLGNSSRDLTVDAYAFYGAENISLISIGNVPNLSIEPRIFTNTMHLNKFQITNTNMKPLVKFTFEGLNNVGEIIFQNCHFESIDEFAFSSITYTPDIRLQMRTMQGPTYDHTSPGGLLNISNSSLSLRTDTFRDTNLKSLIISNNHISEIESHAFKGLHSLSLLEISGNTIGIVESEALGGLSNVDHVKLTQNAIGELNSHVFRDSHTIGNLMLHLRPNSNLDLTSYSFSGLRDIGTLEIKGAAGSTISVARDTFHDLGGVEVLHISNISLPFLGQHTFRGLSKVQTIKFEYCNISRINAAAFGEARSTGAVATIEINEGNNLPCDCQTNKLLRDFESRFSEFTVICYTESAKPRVLTEDTLDWPSCAQSSSAEVLTTFSLHLLLLSSCFCYLLRWQNLMS